MWNAFVFDIPLISQEAADSIDPLPSLSLEYSIVLSPTYCVPVLYFTLREGSSPSPASIDKVLRYLVPKTLQSVVSDTGILGAISLVVRNAQDSVESC